MTDNPAGKCRFRDLWLRHHASLLEIAQESKRDPQLVWDLLLDHPIERSDAHMILCGFNALCNASYTISQIHIQPLFRSYS